MELFDTHAHLDDPQLHGDLRQYLQQAEADGVVRIVTVGCTLASSQAAVRLAAESPLIAAAVGIQPNECAKAQPHDWEAIVKLANADSVVALGETGLDRYWDFAPWSLQQDYFRRHLALSQELDLPVVIHMRDCQAELIQMLIEARQNGPLRGVMHSFTGDADGCAECVDLGLHISFAGMVTFKKSTALREIAAQVPDDRILIETDAPYLTPHPVRKIRPNHPAMVKHTAACLAEVRGVALTDFAQQTRRNARALFGI